MRQLLFTILFLLAVMISQAQNFLAWQYNDRYFSLQLGAGMSSYRGELKHDNSFQNEFSNFGIGLEARLLSKVSARAEFYYASIRGSDSFAKDSTFERQRNLSFEADQFELSLQLQFYMLQYRGDYFRRWSWDPYLFAGFGATTVNPRADYLGERYALRQLETEGVSYSPITMVFPVGAGIKFRITPFINIIAEASYRLTLSDYIDDVSNRFADSYENPSVQLIAIRKDEIGVVNEEAYDNLLVPGGIRGTPRNNDSYLFLNFKFEFYLPSGSSTSKTFKKSPAQ